MTDKPKLFHTSRRPQRRWIEAQQRRDAARAAFEAKPDAEKAEIWARIDRLLFVEARWRVASSMPQNPHAYTKRNTWKSDADFCWLVTMIRDGGIGAREKYDGRWYDVLNYRGCKFWPMCWPLNYSNGTPWTILLNRKPAVLPGDTKR